MLGQQFIRHLCCKDKVLADKNWDKGNICVIYRHILALGLMGSIRTTDSINWHKQLCYTKPKIYRVILHSDQKAKLAVD